MLGLLMEDMTNHLIFLCDTISAKNCRDQVAEERAGVRARRHPRQGLPQRGRHLRPHLRGHRGRRQGVQLEVRLSKISYAKSARSYSSTTLAG